MTTPTTGTAPLIERLYEAVKDEWWFTDHPTVRDDFAMTIADALGDGIWIEREQARETIAEAYWQYGDGELPSWDELGEMGPATKATCFAIADAIIAGLAGEERP